MQQLLDVEAWRQAIVGSVSDLVSTIATYLPSLLAALAILGVGWLLARTAQFLAARSLRRLGLDRAAARTHLPDTLKRARIEATPSQMVARLLFWILMLTFLLSAFEALRLRAVTATIDRLIAYLPNVLAAGLVLLFGMLLGRLARDLVATSAAQAGMTQAARLGSSAGRVVLVVVAALALEQLGIATDVLVSAITVLLGAACVTLGFAFSLGARPIVTHILAGHYLRQSLAGGTAVEVAGRRGVVERVGTVETLVRDEDQSWTIPNNRLMEEIVLRS